MSISPTDLEQALHAIRDQNPSPSDEEDAIAVATEEIVSFTDIADSVGLTPDAARDFLKDVGKVSQSDDALYEPSESESLTFFLTQAISRKRKKSYEPHPEEAPDNIPWAVGILNPSSDTSQIEEVPVQSDNDNPVVVFYFDSDELADQFADKLTGTGSVQVNQPTQHRVVIAIDTWKKQVARWQNA